MDEVSRKRVEKLSEEGYECLDEGNYERALEISRELQELRFTSAFEIGAQAYAGLGEIENAIELLQEGVSLAPEVWLNWQLLGNYLSDVDKFDDAHRAYTRALECAQVRRDSVNLNRAILHNRQNEYSQALAILQNVEDQELLLYKSSTEITALIGLERVDDAIALANSIVASDSHSEEDLDLVGDIAAKLGQAQLAAGKPRNEVRERALQALFAYPNNRMIMALIRDIDNLYSENANYYRALIHCQIDESSPDYADTKGYYCEYDVIAESEDQLLEFVREFEYGIVRGGSYSIEESQILVKNSEDPCGVYWSTGRSFYAEE